MPPPPGKSLCSKKLVGYIILAAYCCGSSVVRCGLASRVKEIYYAVLQAWYTQRNILCHLVKHVGQASRKGGGASAATQEVFPTRPVRETAANSEEGLYFVILKIHRTG